MDEKIMPSLASKTELVCTIRVNSVAVPIPWVWVAKLGWCVSNRRHNTQLLAGRVFFFLNSKQ